MSAAAAAAAVRQFVRRAIGQPLVQSQAWLRDLQMVLPPVARAQQVFLPPSTDNSTDSSINRRRGKSDGGRGAAIVFTEEAGIGTDEEQHLGLAWDGLMTPPDHAPIELDDKDSEISTKRQSSSLLQEWWDGLLLMAVPKKKVSHRRQRRRLVRYDCKNIVHAYTCPACGKPKLRHRLCDDYELCAQQMPAKYKRGTGKEEERQQQQGGAAE